MRYGAVCLSRAAITRARTAVESKISGPLLDRIDIHIEVPAVKYKELRAHRGRAMTFPGRIAEVPQGQGFIAAANMNRDGNVTEMAARAMVTDPSSRGWRMTSRTFR